jgi:hypothetical protein
LKKSTKKLSSVWLRAGPQAEMGKSFLVLFFKKEPLAFFPADTLQ